MSKKFSDMDNNKEPPAPMDVAGAVDLRVVAQLVGWLQMNEARLIGPALASLVDILSKTDEATDVAINCGVLGILNSLLQHRKIKIVENAAWLVSHITAGNHQQVQAVLDSGIFKQLSQIMKTGDFKSQKAAVWAVTNAIVSGTTDQIRVMIDKYDILKAYLDLMDTQCPHSTKLVQTGLIKLLYKAEYFGGLDKLTVLVELLGGLDKLEALQMHEDIEIYKRSFAIIDTFFSWEEDDDKPSNKP